MPVCQPFTLLCQLASRSRTSGRADLHVHTTCSDGSYTPAEVVDLARRSGLAALAITDHDTLEGVAPAQAAALGMSLEIIPGVEITTEHQGRELHLLAYYVQEDGPLLAALNHLRNHRQERFWDMVARLRRCGVVLDEADLRAEASCGVLGRRNLAALLVKARRAGSVREAFQRWLGDGGRVSVPNQRLPVGEALRLVRNAGGLASWAHPNAQHCTRAELLHLRELGLQAVEADYPTFKTKWMQQLRAWATDLGLGVTAGSDCHGPGRELGACSLTAAELSRLRALAAR